VFISFFVLSPSVKDLRRRDKISKKQLKEKRIQIVFFIMGKLLFINSMFHQVQKKEKQIEITWLKVREGQKICFYLYSTFRWRKAWTCENSAAYVPKRCHFTTCRFPTYLSSFSQLDSWFHERWMKCVLKILYKGEFPVDSSSKYATSSIKQLFWLFLQFQFKVNNKFQQNAKCCRYLMKFPSKFVVCGAEN
jgi:hypothetical protein